MFVAMCCNEWGKQTYPGLAQVNSSVYQLINELEDSDMWFVNDDLHITSTGQSTHQDSVKKIVCGSLSYIGFAHGAFFSQKILPALHFLS